MLSKSQALQVMERTNYDGKRIPFSILCLTADRASWQQKRIAKSKLNTLTPGTPEHDQLLQTINSINAGGKILRHPSCVLSKPRGIHAKTGKLAADGNIPATKAPKHYQNRTRNLVLLPNYNTVRKIHIDLILQLNNTPVLY